VTKEEILLSYLISTFISYKRYSPNNIHYSDRACYRWGVLMMLHVGKPFPQHQQERENAPFIGSELAL